jgi:hypothetical protein
MSLQELPTSRSVTTLKKGFSVEAAAAVKVKYEH